MRITNKECKIIDTAVYFLLANLFIFLSIYHSNWNMSILVNISFYVIGFFSFYRVVTIKKNITLLRNFYIFEFIFLYYAALIQYGNHSNIWFGVGLNIEFEDIDYFYTNLLILFFNCILEFFYYFYKPNYNKHMVKFEFSNDCYTIFNLINILSFFFLFATNNINSKSLLNNSNYNLSVQIINILKFIPVSSIIIAVTFKKESKLSFYNKVSLALYIIFFLVLFYPFYGSVSRYLIFGSYLCILTLFCSNFKIKSIFFAMFIFGFLVLFSSFNYFKYNNRLEGFSISFSNLDAEDFDAYQLIMIAIKYTQNRGCLFGKNVLSAILCFIPRSIWSNKCLPSGEIMFDFYGATFTNVSCPVIGEAYISFGIIGILIFSGLLGYAFKRLDNSISKSYSHFIFIIISGFEIYLLRGALLPTWSYTVVNIISLSFMFTVFSLFKRKNKRIYLCKEVIPIKC